MSSSKKLNTFDSLLNRLKKIFPKKNVIETIHTLRTPYKNYPLIKFSVGNGNFRRALISAGIHGDEPGGIETILKFFENKFYSKYKDSWELTFLPCINPYGYDFGTRENHQRKDLNRLFKIEKPPLEVLFAMRKGKKASELLNIFKPTPQILENVLVKDKSSSFV